MRRRTILLAAGLIALAVPARADGALYTKVDGLVCGVGYYDAPPQ